MISRARGSKADADRSPASGGKKSRRKKKKAAAEESPPEVATPPESAEPAATAEEETPEAPEVSRKETPAEPAAEKKRGGKRRGRKKSEDPPVESASRIADLAAEAAEAAEASGAGEADAAAAEPPEDSTPGESTPGDSETSEAGTPAPSPTLTPEDEAELPHLEGDRLRACIESILFASPEPVTRRRLYRLLPEADKAQIRDALLELEGELLTTHRGYFLVEDSSGFRFLSKAEFAPFVARLRGEKRKIRLSAAAFETLAVIAYRQPARRADLEAIRGVQCGAIIKNLMEWNLLRVVGHDDSPGRPLLYGTTGEFLEMLGLASLGELPEPERLRERGEDRGLQVLDRIIEEGGTPTVVEGTEGVGDEGSPDEESSKASSEEASENESAEEEAAPIDAKASGAVEAKDAEAGEDSADPASEKREPAADASGEDEFDLDLEEDEQ